MFIIIVQVSSSTLEYCVDSFYNINLYIDLIIVITDMRKSTMKICDSEDCVRIGECVFNDSYIHYVLHITL